MALSEMMSFEDLLSILAIWSLCAGFCAEPASSLTIRKLAVIGDDDTGKRKIK